MQLKEFINSCVQTVQPGDTLQRAAEKMKELDVGSLPVCDGGQLVGMITDRDITIRAVARGSEPATATVSEVMTPALLCFLRMRQSKKPPGTMQEHQVRRILCLTKPRNSSVSPRGRAGYGHGRSPVGR